MEDINRILVVSRMTTYCRKAVHYGVSLSKKYGASLYVIHVVHNPFGLEGWNLPPLEENYSAQFKKSKEDIDAAIDAEREKGMEIKEIIRAGDPTEVIMDVIREENIDLVVMLAHEEGRLEHFLFGLSNEEIIRRLPCSIVLVKKEPAIFGATY